MDMVRYTIPKVGRAIQSSDWYRYIGAFAVDYVDHGFQVTQSSGLNVIATPGRIYIQGIALESDADEQLTMQASAINHIFVRLIKDAQGKPLDWQFVVNTNGSRPQDSIKIAEVTTSSNSISSIVDRRALGDLAYMFIGTYSNIDPKPGLLVSDPSMKYLLLRDSSNTRWIPLLGSKGNDYPFFGLYEARDHFNRENLNLTGLPQLYIVSSAFIESSDLNVRNHAVTAGGSIANGASAFWRANFTVRPTLQDAFRTFSKAIVEIRFRLVSRANGVRHAFGLIDGLAGMDAFANGIRRICIAVDGTGNFQVRWSNGSTDSSINTVQTSDTNWHILRIEWSSSSARVMFDNVEIANLNNVPNTPLNIFSAVYNATGATTSIFNTVDYWYYTVE